MYNFPISLSLIYESTKLSAVNKQDILQSSEDNKTLYLYLFNSDVNDDNRDVVVVTVDNDKGDDNKKDSIQLHRRR